MYPEKSRTYRYGSPPSPDFLSAALNNILFVQNITKRDKSQVVEIKVCPLVWYYTGEFPAYIEHTLYVSFKKRKIEQTRTVGWCGGGGRVTKARWPVRRNVCIAARTHKRGAGVWYRAQAAVAPLYARYAVRVRYIEGCQQVAQQRARDVPSTADRPSAACGIDCGTAPAKHPHRRPRRYALHTQTRAHANTLVYTIRSRAHTNTHTSVPGGERARAPARHNRSHTHARRAGTRHTLATARRRTVCRTQ